MKKQKKVAQMPTEPKPEFEQALKQVASDVPAEAISDAEKKDGRGGARPGAGRPMGVTDDLALVNRLPQKPNLTLIPVLRIPFEIWAQGQGVPGLALKKDEAEELALPVTQLLEFYFPGRIPEIAWVWLMLLGSIYNVVEPRMKLLAELRKQKASVTAGGRGLDENPSDNSVPASTGPLEGYPKAKG